MRLLKPILLLILLFPVSAQCIQKLKIGLDEWPPFASQTLPGRGLSAEVIKSAFAKSGYQVEIQFSSWLRVESGVKNGSLDAMGNLYDIPEIEKYAEYSNPYYVSEVILLANKDFSHKITNLKEVEPYQIAYGLGYSFGEVFDKNKKLKKVPVPLTVNGLKMLKQGKVDMVIDSEEVLDFYIDTESQLSHADFKELPFAVTTNNMSIGVLRTNRKKKEIIEAFNKGLSLIKSDGSYDRIINKYKYK